MRRVKRSKAVELLNIRKVRVIQAVRDFSTSRGRDELNNVLQAINDLDRIDQAHESVYFHDDDDSFRDVCIKCSERTDYDNECVKCEVFVTDNDSRIVCPKCVDFLTNDIECTKCLEEVAIGDFVPLCTKCAKHIDNGD